MLLPWHVLHPLITDTLVAEPQEASQPSHFHFGVFWLGATLHEQETAQASLLRLPIAFSRVGKKQNGSDFQFALSRAEKKRNGSNFQLVFSRAGWFTLPGKNKMVQTSNLGQEKAKLRRLPICVFPTREKAICLTDQKQLWLQPNRRPSANQQTLCVCVSSARSCYILRTARWSHRPCCVSNYSRRTNHLTSHSGHAMSASAAGVSSACFQQEEWSGVGFGPVVFRVRNANLSPYLRSFPPQRISQGRGKAIGSLLQIGSLKRKWYDTDFQFAFSRAGKKQNGSDFQFAFSQAEKKQNGSDFQFAFSRAGKKQNGSDFQFAFSQAGKKQNGSDFQFPFSPGREKAIGSDFQFAYSRPGKKQNG